MADYTVQNDPQLVDDTINKVQELKQTTGTSTTEIMSQKAVTESLDDIAVDIVQQLGNSTSSVMSQNANTNLLANKEHFHTTSDIKMDSFAQLAPFDDTQIDIKKVVNYQNDTFMFGAKYHFDSNLYNFYIIKPYNNDGYMDYQFSQFPNNFGGETTDYGGPLYGMSLFEPEIEPERGPKFRVITKKGVFEGSLENPGEASYSEHNITDNIHDFRYKQLDGTHVIYAGTSATSGTFQSYSKLYVSEDSITWTTVETPASEPINGNYKYIYDVDYFNGKYYLSADGVWSTTDLNANTWEQVLAPGTEQYSLKNQKISVINNKIIIPEADQNSYGSSYINYSDDGLTWNKSSAISNNDLNYRKNIIYSNYYNGYMCNGGPDSNDVKLCVDPGFSSWTSLGNVNAQHGNPDIYALGSTIFCISRDNIYDSKIYARFENQKNIIQIKDGGTGGSTLKNVLSNLGIPNMPNSGTYALKCVDGILNWVSE